MIELVKPVHYDLNELTHRLFYHTEKPFETFIVVFPNQHLVEFRSRRFFVEPDNTSVNIEILASVYNLVSEKDLSYSFFYSTTYFIEKYNLEQVLETVSGSHRCFPDILFYENDLRKIWEESKPKIVEKQKRDKSIVGRFFETLKSIKSMNKNLGR